MQNWHLKFFNVNLGIELIKIMSVENKIIKGTIVSKIYEVRGANVMLDRDLADLYEVETKQLKRQVRRNIERFPKDFMFELTKEEFELLRSQIDTSSWGGTRYMPMAFTEQGISMLSSVLNSKVAIQVNIQIIRVFTQMREMLLTHKDLLLELEEIRKGMANQDERIDMVFDYLTKFITLEEDKEPIQKIGFKPKKK